MTSHLLSTVDSPADVRRMSRDQLKQLARELRDHVLHSVAQTGGHLSSNLGTVELTVALHYVFDTPPLLSASNAMPAVMAPSPMTAMA